MLSPTCSGHSREEVLGRERVLGHEGVAGYEGAASHEGVAGREGEKIVAVSTVMDRAGWGEHTIFKSVSEKLT